MATTYPLIGANASLGTIGSANFYSGFVGSLVATSARVSLVNNGQDITGIGVFAVDEIPGLTSGTSTIGGYTTPSTVAGGGIPYIGNVCTFADARSGAYAVDVQSFDILLRTMTVHDITKMTGTPTLMDFRPDIVQASVRVNCMMDANTAVKMPSVIGDTITTITLTYGVSNTLIFTGGANFRTLAMAAARGQKSSVQYSINSCKTFTTSGTGPLGSFTIGGANNTHPLWSAGSTAVCPASYNWLGSGTRKIDFADGFWTAIRIRANVVGVVAAEMDLQHTGAITLT